MTEKEFNELVWNYGANGTDFEDVRSLSDAQIEIVNMAWYASQKEDDENSADEVINTYYTDFINC